MRHHFPFAVLLLLPLLGACQPVSTVDIPRTVTVNGEGEISVPPEVATVRLAVEARDRDLAAAQAAAGQAVDAVLKLTDALDIPREQVQSTQLRVHPEFDWNEGRQQFRGYLVQREIRVELEKLEKLGPLVERALAAGVNNISPPELDVRDPRALHRKVLQLAAADAKANAAAIAQTLEASLGDARRVTAMPVNGPPVPMMEMRMARAADSGAEQTYAAGQITVRAGVQAEFELR